MWERKRHNPNLVTDTPYRQGEDKGGLLVPKKDKYKLCSLLDKAHPKFQVQAAEDSQICQNLRYQNRTKGLVWRYINIDAMHFSDIEVLQNTDLRI